MTRRLYILQVDYRDNAEPPAVRRTYIGKESTSDTRAMGDAERAFRGLYKGLPQRVFVVASYPLDFIPT